MIHYFSIALASIVFLPISAMQDKSDRASASRENQTLAQNNQSSGLKNVQNQLPHQYRPCVGGSSSSGNDSISSDPHNQSASDVLVFADTQSSQRILSQAELRRITMRADLHSLFASEGNDVQTHADRVVHKSALLPKTMFFAGTNASKADGHFGSVPKNRTSFPTTNPLPPQLGPSWEDQEYAYLEKQERQACDVIKNQMQAYTSSKEKSHRDRMESFKRVLAEKSNSELATYAIELNASLGKLIERERELQDKLCEYTEIKKVQFQEFKQNLGKANQIKKHYEFSAASKNELKVSWELMQVSDALALERAQLQAYGKRISFLRARMVDEAEEHYKTLKAAELATLIKDLQQQKELKSKQSLYFTQRSIDRKIDAQNIESTLDSWFTLFGRRKLRAEQAQAEADAHSACIDGNQVNYELSVICGKLESAKKILKAQEHEKEQETRALSELVDGKEALYNAQESKPIDAVEQTVTAEGVAYRVIYALDSTTVSALEKLDINVVQDISTELNGTDLQHNVYRSLFQSLNRIGTISQDHAHVSTLLKTAAACNITGQALVREQRIIAALQAKEACDRILDLGAAIFEGGLDGAHAALVTSTEFAAATIEVALLDKERLAKVASAFQQATLATSKLISKLNEDIMLLARGDDASLKELGERHMQRGQRFVKFVQDLSVQWSAMNERDRVKSVAKFFTEWECFGAIGRAVGSALKAERAVEIGEKALGELTIPEAFAEEVINISAHTLDKNPALVQRVIEFVQNDANFLENIRRAENSVSKELGNVFSRDAELINFTETTIAHMNDSNRYVPVQIMDYVIKNSKGFPDPQGTGALMYYSEMYKNKKMYNLEVLYHKETNTIQHFLYSEKAMGPLLKKGN